MGRILAVPYSTGELMSWFDPTGVEYALNGDAYLFLDNPGRTGFKSLPPMMTTVLNVPLTDGDVPRFTLASPRPLSVHTLIKGSNPTDFEQVRTVLQNGMNPKLGSGFFRCTRQDGTRRDINCKYVDGFIGDESWGVSSSVHQELLLGFVAHDPYFYDTLATVLTFTATAATNFFPITPLRLSSTSIGSGFSIFNSGDVESFPVFTIQGPGTNPLLTNTTTGKALLATITLGAGQVLTIDTGAKTVTRDDGSNQFGTLGLSSVLWSLAVGQNALTLAMGGAGVGSQITVAYKQRWNSL
jgi:Phage tail protein